MVTDLYKIYQVIFFIYIFLTYIMYGDKMKMLFKFVFISGGIYSVMNGSNGYKTRQREAILNYMVEHKNSHVTVNQLSDYFESKGTPIGVTTIYRHLEKLLEQNLVRKYSTGGSNGACFQYAPRDKECREHFHFMCEKCGCLFHLECERMAELYSDIFSKHGFRIDPFRTVIYGICQKCLTVKDGQEGNGV